MDEISSIRKQLVILCDEKGDKIGEYYPRLKAHTGNGKKHLAVTLVLVNKKGQFLLQRRKHRIFDNFWDLTAATDLLHLEHSDEDWGMATKRCLNREYSLRGLRVENIGGFDYFRRDGKLCENEYCYLILGQYLGKVNLNPEVGYEYKWMDAGEVIKDIENDPKKYTPWAQEAVKLLKSHK